MIKLQNVNDMLPTGRQDSVNDIYNKMSIKSQEFITREDVESVYQTVEEEVEFNLLTDEYGNVYGKIDSQHFNDVVFKFMKTVKAIKRGSQITNWSKDNYPNFSKNVDDIQYNMMYYSEVMDFDSLFKNTTIRGKSQKNVILNLLFSLVLNIDATEYHELTKNQQYQQFKQFVENVSKVFNEVKES